MTTTTKKQRLWNVNFCCNDYRNGAFAGRCEDVFIHCGAMELTIAPRAGDLKFTYTKKGFRIGRKEFESGSFVDWVGNWCWNGTVMAENQMRELCKTLKKWGWRPDSGSSMLWRWFEAL